VWRKHTLQCHLAGALTHHPLSETVTFWVWTTCKVPSSSSSVLLHYAVNFWDYIASAIYKRMRVQHGALVEVKWQGKTEIFGEKPVLVPLHPPKIPHELAWDWTWHSTVKGNTLRSYRWLPTLQGTCCLYLGLKVRSRCKITASQWVSLQGIQRHLVVLAECPDVLIIMTAAPAIKKVPILAISFGFVCIKHGWGFWICV
jgi:hypothetical protein